VRRPGLASANRPRQVGCVPQYGVHDEVIDPTPNTPSPQPCARETPSRLERSPRELLDLVGRLKEDRRIAACYEKLAASNRAFPARRCPNVVLETGAGPAPVFACCDYRLAPASARPGRVPPNPARSHGGRDASFPYDAAPSAWFGRGKRHGPGVKGREHHFPILLRRCLDLLPKPFRQAYAGTSAPRRRLGRPFPVSW
jgi:hypothetical protein